MDSFVSFSSPGFSSSVLLTSLLLARAFQGGLLVISVKVNVTRMANLFFLNNFGGNRNVTNDYIILSTRNFWKYFQSKMHLQKLDCDETRARTLACQLLASEIAKYNRFCDSRTYFPTTKSFNLSYTKMMVSLLTPTTFQFGIVANSN